MTSIDSSSTPKSSPSRWPRYLPKQFSLRTLLVMSALAAIFTWWYVQPPKGTISAWKAGRVSIGMTKEQVIALAGMPPRVSLDLDMSTWAFEVDNGSWQERTRLFVFFENLKVKSVTLGKGSEFDVAYLFLHSPERRESLWQQRERVRKTVATSGEDR